MSDEQVEDQIDLALSYYADFHFDGTQKTYYKIPITANLYSDAIHHLTLVSAGTLYSNADTITITSSNVGNTATANLVTYANGTINTVNLIDNGANYGEAPTVTITTSTGSGASITSTLGGYAVLPENIIGISRVFPFHFFSSSNDMFSVEYQFALNNLYTIANSALVPFYMAKQQLQMFQEVLIGRPSFRFNRHANKLYIDVNNARLKVGEYLVVEAYMVLDETTYTDIFKDRMLIRYTCALLKKLWAFNLKKFNGMSMPGGLAFNGQTMYDEAIQEIKDLEAEMLNSWSLPVCDLIG
tara:strand:- start:2108 stop:3004 length:897 start_codon:yes stop_codon:yes gene_type:complete